MEGGPHADVEGKWGSHCSCVLLHVLSQYLYLYVMCMHNPVFNGEWQSMYIKQLGVCVCVWFNILSAEQQTDYRIENFTLQVTLGIAQAVIWRLLGN